MKTKRTLSRILGIVLILGLSVFTSCKKSENSDEDVATDQNKFSAAKFHKLLIDDQQIIIKEDSGEYFFADDIILTATQFATMKKMANLQTSATERSAITKELFRRWTNGVVYYTLNLGADNSYAQTAMRNISAVTPIRFVQRTNQSNYVNFVKSNGNNSALGMTGGRQTINLYNSNRPGIITHEILHALGVNHEQCRPDRGNSIRIRYENIPDELEHNFNAFSSYQGVGAFDFGSIMMYSAYAFSSNGQPTITKLDGSLYTSQVNSLSQGDINGLNQLY